MPQIALEQRTIYFEFDSTRLTSDGVTKLDQLVSVINQSTAIMEVSIHGFTDDDWSLLLDRIANTANVRDENRSGTGASQAVAIDAPCIFASDGAQGWACGRSIHGCPPGAGSDEHSLGDAGGSERVKGSLPPRGRLTGRPRSRGCRSSRT